MSLSLYPSPWTMSGRKLHVSYKIRAKKQALLNLLGDRGVGNATAKEHDHPDPDFPICQSLNCLFSVRRVQISEGRMCRRERTICSEARHGQRALLQGEPFPGFGRSREIKAALYVSAQLPRLKVSATYKATMASAIVGTPSIMKSHCHPVRP